MKTLTPSGAPRVPPSSPHRWRHRGRLRESIGEARLMVGNAILMMCARAEFTQGLPFRCRHRPAVAAGDFAPDSSRLRARHAHDEGQGDGPWSRSLPRGRREARPATDRYDPYEAEAFRLWALKQRGK